MILVPADGEIRVWESMSLALANVERYQGVQLELGEDDFAERIWRIEVSITPIYSRFPPAYS